MYNGLGATWSPTGVLLASSTTDVLAALREAEAAGNIMEVFTAQAELLNILRALSPTDPPNLNAVDPSSGLTYAQIGREYAAASVWLNARVTADATQGTRITPTGTVPIYAKTAPNTAVTPAAALATVDAAAAAAAAEHARELAALAIGYLTLLARGVSPQQAVTALQAELQGTAGWSNFPAELTAYFGGTLPQTAPASYQATAAAQAAYAAASPGTITQAPVPRTLPDTSGSAGPTPGGAPGSYQSPTGDYPSPGTSPTAAPGPAIAEAGMSGGLLLGGGLLAGLVLFGMGGKRRRRGRR